MTTPDWTAEYPFSSKFRDWNGLKYHYVDEGAGSPLLFVHGNPTWSFAWRRLLQEFKRDHRVLAVDHIGCGMSDKPQDYSYTLDQHVRNLCHFIEDLDLRGITLVAHDWGGAIGMGAATRLPDRFNRFVLCNTAAFRSQQIPFRIWICRTPLLGTLGLRGLNLFSLAALKMAVRKPERMTLEAKAGYLAPYDSWNNRIAVERFVQDIPLKPSHLSYATLEEIEQKLSQFQSAPMLLPWGMQDWCFTPQFLAEFQRRFPHAEACPIAEAGHYLFEDSPETLISCMRRFLAKS